MTMKGRNITCDVAVVGGGSAGIAAAIGAHDAGAKTILIERSPYFGGQATNAQVHSYCGFCTNGEDWQQVVKGAGQRVLDKLKELGHFDGFSKSPTGNLLVWQDPEYTKLALDDIVSEAGFDYLLCAGVIGADVKDGQIISLECADDNGRFTVNAKSFVDASGEANLSFMAGFKTEFHCEQSGGLVFRMGNVKTNRDYSPASIKSAIERAISDGMSGFSATFGTVGNVKGTNDYIVNIISLKIPGLDAETQTRFEMEGRRQVHAYAEAFKKYLPGFEDSWLISSGPKMGYRESRRIIGEYQLCQDDVKNSRKYPETSIARGGWGAELHIGDSDVTFGEERGAKYFDIPIGSLRPEGAQNLWCGGRIICADLIASSSIRVMGTGFATGQAAGVSAALSMNNSDGRYDVSAIRSELVRQGALV
ncbi:MAG: FAD-dependent oxidoreductase [Synergistaceae bacterium]|nr:FAD-dependent oxidoreductase [Synergistaceae bacterium]